MAKAMFDGSSVGVARLLEAAPVVSGAVISKPLLDTDRCKVVLFALDEGQSIREHRAPYMAMVQVLEGRLDFGTAGERHAMSAHDWMILPFDARHDLTALEPTRFLLTLFR